MALRQLLARHAVGSGIEVGPGHRPFDLTFEGSTVHFVDRWQPSENRQLFPELGEDAPFTAPDIVADFDTDGLRPIADASQDFVICSHVLEHLAEPIGFLGEVHRVLRPGGVAVILLPDRRRTFDRDRQPTTLEHLIVDHQAKVTAVDDAHILECLANTIGLPADPHELPALLELHRSRSIHVHCWTDEEFLPVLRYTVEEGGMRWEFIDGLLTDEGGSEGFEFGFVLRRSTVAVDPKVLARRLVDSWEAWRSARSADLESRHAVARLVEALQAEVARQRSSLDRLHRTAAYRSYRLLRRLARRSVAEGG